MKTSHLHSAVIAMLLCACGNAPAISTECTTDDDCALLTNEDRNGHCCSICGSQAASKVGAERHREWCSEHPGGPDDCPRLDCPRSQDTAVCEFGHCAVHSTP